jgi:hypothetical protein
MDELTNPEKTMDEKHGIKEGPMSSHLPITGSEDVPMVMRDGIKLHPQPTSDPLDPLNWSRWRKNAILAIVMSLYVT